MGGVREPLMLQISSSASDTLRRQIFKNDLKILQIRNMVMNNLFLAGPLLTQPQSVDG